MAAGTETQINSGRGWLWLLHLLPALIMASCFVYGATIYESLPPTVPTHWGADGHPDDWSPKSFGPVFFPLMMGAGVSVLLLLIAAVVPAMVPPDTKATRWARYRREGVLRGTIAALGGTSVLTAVMIGFLTVAGWRSPDHVPLWPALALTALILGVIPASYAQASRWARRSALAQGIHPTAAEQSDERRWIAGVLYNNSGDPRILVPKPAGTGTGLTVNVGHPKGRAAVVVFLTVFVALPVILAAVPML